MSTRTCLKYRRLLRKQADGPRWLWATHRDPISAGSFAFCFYRTYASTNAREKAGHAIVDAWQPQPTSAARIVDKLSASTSQRQRAAKSTETASAKKTLLQQKKPEEQIAEIEQLMNASRLHPVADVWGQKVQLLGGSSKSSVFPSIIRFTREDVQIPYSISLNPLKRRGNSWATTFTHIKSNFSNSLKNAAR
jgi:hypothetical protein